jgi:hypothetical protein
MRGMESATVINLAGRRERGRRMARAIDMRRTLEPADRRRRGRSGGRLWVNGHELGGEREALAHLAATHD